MIKMELQLYAIKLLVAGIMAAATLIMGVMPIKMAACTRGKTKEKATGDKDRGRWSVAMSCWLQCFCAGALLAISLIHLLPKVKESVHDSQLSGVLPLPALPVAELCVCAGIVLVWLVEEFGHCIMDPHAIEGSLRNVLLLVALSVYAVFEGVAIGLEESSTYIWYLALAVSIKKLDTAFTMRLKLGNNSFWALGVFSFMSPVGIVTATFLTEHLARGTLGVLQAIATGAILYVVFFKILFQQLSKKTPAFLKILFLVIGFAFIVSVSSSQSSLQGHQSHMEQNSMLHPEETCSTQSGCPTKYSSHMHTGMGKESCPFQKDKVYNSEDDKRSEARSQIGCITTNYGTIEPVRGEVLDGIVWRHGSPPDYAVANLAYLRGKTRNHSAGSLELLVENLVKRWEMEASHFIEYDQWTTINQELYAVQANGGKIFKGSEASKRGNYNTLMDGVREDLYNARKETFESSHSIFNEAFPNGFPFEILEVYSGPPKVSFSWRHWASFDGEYKNVKGDGRLVEMIGSGVITLKDMKVVSIEIFYKPEEFLESLMNP